MTKVAHTYRLELWEYKTLVKLAEHLGKDETATIVEAVKELAQKKSIEPSVPCVNMLQVRADMIVICKKYGDVSAKLKCFNCEDWKPKPTEHTTPTQQHEHEQTPKEISA